MTLLATSYPRLVKSFSAYSYSKFSAPHFPRNMISSGKTQLFSSSEKAALLNCPKVELHDGTNHPCIGFGTYKVGKAISKSGIPREELFLCSKVWTTTIEQGPQAIRAQLDKTLSDLGTDYIDLYLIHWPVPGKHVDAYKTLEELSNEGKIRGIGLSNYAVEDYVELKDSGIKIKPFVNQIEINPFLYRKNTIAFFNKEGIVLQSYRSLRNGKDLDNPALVKIGEAHGKTSAQVLGRWCIQKGFVYMPKSVKKERMQENAMVFDFELTEQEVSELDSLTTPESLQAFEDLYRKCVNRDTSKDGTMDGVKMSITVD